jgi:hypothetical protein
MGARLALRTRDVPKRDKLPHERAYSLLRNGPPGRSDEAAKL